MLTYKGMRGIVNRSGGERRPDCYVCGYPLVGQRDNAIAFRYIRTEPPRDISDNAPTCSG